METLNNEIGFLGMAAVAKSNALDAIKAKEYDRAWRYLHEQKQFYAQHAVQSGFTLFEILQLDGSVSEHFANILRLENKHTDALVHMIYVISTSLNPNQTQAKKLSAYLKRAKINNISIDDVNEFIRKMSNPNLKSIQEKVVEWKIYG